MYTADTDLLESSKNAMLKGCWLLGHIADHSLPALLLLFLADLTLQPSSCCQPLTPHCRRFGFTVGLRGAFFHVGEQNWHFHGHDVRVSEMEPRGPGKRRCMTTYAPILTPIMTPRPPSLNCTVATAPGTAWHTWLQLAPTLPIHSPHLYISEAPAIQCPACTSSAALPWQAAV